MTMRILITGWAGFIGSHLARRLANDRHAVIILDSLLPQVHGDAPRINLPECEIRVESGPGDNGPQSRRSRIPAKRVFDGQPFASRAERSG